MSDIETRVKTVIATQLGVATQEVKNESSFINDLGADSLDTVELAVALGNELGVEISNDEAEELTTVQHVIDYAHAHERAAGK
ncbi:acyl carrier protein [Streptomyces sp. NPDC097981]|uniref:acyl carrier protein n=1 Tax=Streptomyces sp. NPDC097981 TaxID=3155428 RepID=UPI00332AEB7B